VAVVSFDTRVPTPPAALACGVLPPDRPLRVPQFCRVVREEGGPDARTHHEIRVDLAQLEERCGDLDPGLREATGGTVEVEIEIHDPRLQQGIVVPLRFAYRGARRVPCLSDGPWFDVVDSTRAVISWGTDRPARGVVRYASGGATRALAFPAGRRSRVELTGLAPGEPCRYRITLVDPAGPDSVDLGPFTLRTPRPDEPFLFAVFGDSRAGPGPGEARGNGVNLRTLRALCRAAAEDGAAFVLFSGDMADGQTTRPADLLRQWGAWKSGADILSHRLPVYETVGNHEACRRVDGDSVPRVVFDREGAESAAALFTEVFAAPANGPARESPEAPEYGSTAYSFRWGRALFLVLNTCFWLSSAPEACGGNLDGYVMDRQLEWVERTVREGTADPAVDHVFAMFHDPAFPCGGHLHDSMWYSGGDPAQNRGPRGEPVDRSYVLARRDRLWGAFARSGKARAVFAGHEHNYSRLLVGPATPVRPDGGAQPAFTHPVWQCVSGGGGAPTYARGTAVPWAKEIAAFSQRNHYVLVGVDGGDVGLFAIDDAGAEIDGRLIAADGRVADRPLTLAEWRARSRRSGR
jgi:hypothetical protein